MMHLKTRPTGVGAPGKDNKPTLPAVGRTGISVQGFA